MSGDSEKISNDIRLFEAQYISQLQFEIGFRFPDFILDKYQIIACLSSRKESETYTVVGKFSGETYILKVLPAEKGAARREDEVLRELAHPHIPRLIDTVQTGSKVYVVRQYFEGYPLSASLSGGRTYTIAETLDIALKLCGILEYLHGRPCPIIYRDIKPQNIIVSPEGDVKLIDFDIARQFDSSATSDTQYYGTREYSPPEQYGFAQTDARTDVYALGMLMIHMLTGSPDQMRLSRINDAFLRRILKTCTEFAPKDRFAEIRTLAGKLEAIKRKSVRRVGRLMLLVLTIAVCLGAGFWFGVYMERNRVIPEIITYSADSTIVFESDLIDEAVRMALDKTHDESIYYRELAQVVAIRIWGQSVHPGEQDLTLGYDPGFTDVAAYVGDYSGERLPVSRGDIQSLEEIGLLSNLKELDMVMEQISDISPLKGLPLERLNLAGNRITDLSPLVGMNTLVSLNIDYNPVSDLAPVGSLHYLNELNASDTLIEDVSPLGELYYLDYLYINNARVKDVTPLRNLELINCFLQNNEIQDISPLHVENLHVEGNPGAQ